MTLYANYPKVVAGAKFLYRNRKQFVKYAREAQRLRNQVGQPRNHHTSKKADIISNTTNSLQIGSLYTVDLTNLTRDVGPTGTGLFRANIDKRARGLCYISGFKLNIIYQNKRATPVILRWAVVHPKGGQSFSTAGFFRAWGTSRDLDFGGATTCIQANNLPISSDRFHVLAQGKKQLNAVNNPNVWNEQRGGNHFFLRRWIRLKRQIRYNDDSTEDAESRIYFCYWVNNIIGTVSQSADSFEVQSEIVTYFRDPK